MKDAVVMHAYAVLLPTISYRYLGFVSPTAQEVEDTAKTDVSQYFNVVAGCNYCCKSMC